MKYKINFSRKERIVVINFKKWHISDSKNFKELMQKYSVCSLSGKVAASRLENISEKSENMLAGYTDTMKLVNVKADKKYLGKIVNVKINEVKTWSMNGEIEE